jgi:hypothetical protein
MVICYRMQPVRQYVVEYGVTPLASRQIDRCAAKFPTGQDRIAEWQHEEGGGGGGGQHQQATSGCA